MFSIVKHAHMVDQVWLHVAHHGETRQLLGGKHDERKHTVMQLCVKMAPRMKFFLNSCAVDSVNEGLMGGTHFALFMKGVLKTLWSW